MRPFCRKDIADQISELVEPEVAPAFPPREETGLRDQPLHGRKVRLPEILAKDPFQMEVVALAKRIQLGC
jgi:hypothetical protein